MGTFREKRGHKCFCMARRSHRKITFTASWRLGNVLFTEPNITPWKTNARSSVIERHEGIRLVFQMYPPGWRERLFPGNFDTLQKSTTRLPHSEQQWNPSWQRGQVPHYDGWSHKWKGEKTACNFLPPHSEIIFTVSKNARPLKYWMRTHVQTAMTEKEVGNANRKRCNKRSII